MLVRYNKEFMLVFMILLLAVFFYGCGNEGSKETEESKAAEEIGGYEVNENIDPNLPALGQNVPPEMIGIWEATDDNGTYAYEFRENGTAIFKQNDIELPCIYECLPQDDGTVKLFLDIRFDADNTQHLITFFKIDGDVLSIVVDGEVKSTMQRVKGE